MERRLVALRCLVVICFILFLARLIQLQLLEGARNRKMADENRIRVIRRLAPRGTIYDRHGHILAGSRLAFSVTVVPEELQMRGYHDTAAGLAWLLDLPVSKVREALASSHRDRREPVLIWREVNPQTIARLEEHSIYLSGVNIIAEAVRQYPQGPLAAHVLGYVREVGPEQLAQPEMHDYHAHDLVGTTGVEKIAEPWLRGTDGGDQIEVDARGRHVRTLGTVIPEAGHDVWLTLDLKVQQAAESALGDRAGAVVAMDPWTGAIIALVSHPAYDPNIFASQVKPSEWRRLSGPEHPQQNRAIAGQYEPGSVFKLITAISALESGKCDLHQRVYCDGSYSLGKWRLRCWKRDGHGWVDFFQGFGQSCNVLFASLGRRVGPVELAKMACKLGLGDKCGIDLSGEASGLVATPKWKRRARKQPWYPGDTCQMAIGQGFSLVTPLQAARLVAVIANGGKLVRPFVISRVEGDNREAHQEQADSVGLNAQTMETIRAGMEAVVATGGTAHGIASSHYSIAGKTGTAETPHGKSHAWFVAYAPTDHPQLVVVVLVEHGGSGTAVAAPIARQVLDAALEK